MQGPSSASADTVAEFTEVQGKILLAHQMWGTPGVPVTPVPEEHALGVAVKRLIAGGRISVVEDIVSRL